MRFEEDRSGSESKETARERSAASSRLGRAGAVAVMGCVSLGCATRQGTAQALTIAGAAAVVVGASMAADNRCNQITPEGTGPGVFCSSGLSRGARRAGTAVAVAGAGLAAAGYALTPKGPDRLQGGVNALPAPAAPYRLVRAAPPELPEPPEQSSPPARVESSAEEHCRSPDTQAAAGEPGAEETPGTETEPGAQDTPPAAEASPPCAADGRAAPEDGARTPNAAPPERAPGEPEPGPRIR